MDSGQLCTRRYPDSARDGNIPLPALPRLSPGLTAPVPVTDVQDLCYSKSTERAPQRTDVQTVCIECKNEEITISYRVKTKHVQLLIFKSYFPLKSSSGKFKASRRLKKKLGICLFISNF